MSDPERLVGSGGGQGGGATGLEHLLLSAGRRETPSSELQLRMARGLGISAAGIGGGAVAPAPASVSSTGIKVAGAAATSSSTIPWLAVGVLASVVAVGFGVRAIVQRTAGGGVVEPAAVSTSAPAAAPGAQVAAVAAAPAGAQVADEVRVLDAARVALRAHQPARALENLDGYAHRHPRGVLSPEAAVLRIEALNQDGRQAQAAALARAFLAENPGSPLRGRVERLTSGR